MSAEKCNELLTGFGGGDHCKLPLGHDGWHEGDDGALWADAAAASAAMTAHDPAAPEPGTGTREALAEALHEAPLSWDFFPEPAAAIETLVAALAPEVARIETEAREAERERIAAAIDALFVKGWLVYNSGIADAARIARSRP